MESIQVGATGVYSLLDFVGESIEARRRNRVNLLSELTPRLHAARRVELELDRHLARRFNVFKYLRTDELGLSRIIADLLDPTADHGQGKLFLRAMLDAIPETRYLSEAIQESPNDSISVVIERQIERSRRIDISVDIPTDDGPYCLAFENKPYAGDQRNQIADYLEYLFKTYKNRFLLVYVPPDFREPDEFSIRAADLDRWRCNFRVMPYANGGVSLESWLASCRKLCEPDRLNLFLQQFQTLCQMKFGEATMSSDAETREIRTYLRQNPNQLQSALAIHDAWQVIRAEICEQFLELLRDKLRACMERKGSKFNRGLRVQCVYGGDKRGANSLWIARDDWPPFEVKLQSGGFGPRSWYWGVCCKPSAGQMTEEQLQIRKDLKAALVDTGIPTTRSDDGEWPSYEWLSKHANWLQLAPELFAEIENGGGEVTDHFVEGLHDIASCAIPVLDQFASAAIEHWNE